MDSQVLSEQTTAQGNDEISKIITKIIKAKLSNSLNQDVNINLALHTFRLFADKEANAEIEASFACDKDLLGHIKSFIGIAGIPIIKTILVEPIVSSWVKGKIKNITEAKIDFNISNLTVIINEDKVNISAKAIATAKQKEFDVLLNYLKRMAGAEFSLFLSGLSITLNNGAFNFSINANGSIDANAIETIYSKIRQD